jgi:hypothetical protein
MQNLETCVADREAKIQSDAATCSSKRQAAEEACGARDEAADIELPSLCIETKCNLASGSSCSVTEYKTIMDGVVATVAEKERVYNQKVAQCSTAQDEAARLCAAAEDYAKTDSCSSSREVLSAKSSTCEHTSESASVAICSFGGQVQTKCADLSAIHDLVTEIKSSSREDSLSEPDRQAEWAAIQRLSCLLEALRDDGDLSTEASQKCADSRPYPKTFDYLDARIAELACDQTSFSFSGYSWIMGETADQCVRSATSLEFTAAADKAPFALCGENTDSELVIGEGIKLVKNTKAGEVQASQNFEVSFVVTPHGTVSGWSNIIHFTQTGKNCCDEGDRMPAVWFYSSTTKLHIRSGRQGGGNDGCDPTDQLPIGQATKVDIRVQGGKMQVFYSGNKVCETSSYSSPTAPSGTMVAWAADPWHTASDATLAHLSYTRL